MTDTNIRIYAACLASYNNGVLHGAWIDADSDVDTMQEQIATMLRESRFPNVTVEHPETGEQVPSAEEWAMHDSEGLPSSFGEYPGLDKIAAFVELCDERSEDSDDLAAIVDNWNGDVEEAKNNLDDRFCGIYDAFKDYAEGAADEMIAAHGGAENKLPECITNYFDYDAYARDLKHDMTTVDVPSGVAVFHS